MKKDTSRILYDKYFKLANRNIEIVLKNGRRIKGMIVGYFSSDTENEESPIHHWHIVDGTPAPRLDFSGLGFNQGDIIKHCDIVSVTFEEDQSTMFL